MDTLNPKVIKLITWYAGIGALVVAILLPTVYFTLSYQNHMGGLDAEAEINGRLATQIINANPQMWRFQQPKLEEFLKRRPRHGEREARRIYDNDNRVVAESVDPLDTPVLSGSYDLLDAGVRVGHLEISRSLRPLLLRATGVLLFSSVFALALFFLLRTIPLRLLRRALADNARYLDHLEIAKEKLERANSALTVQAAELARSNTELQHFAYIASHDLQEPLRMVASFVQLLARRYKGNLDKDADEFIAFAVDGATRMQALINALLAYSRVGTKGKPFEPVDCEKVLSTTLRNLQMTIDESQAIVTHDPLPTVMADPMQIDQLLQNLIGNSVKFRSKEAPRIHISAERNGADWYFSHSDNGIGIDPQFSERIFIIFQRLHGGHEYPGTGIGLALCKKIVERHGGRIWMDPNTGAGVTFRFTIPVIHSAEKEV